MRPPRFDSAPLVPVRRRRVGGLLGSLAVHGILVALVVWRADAIWDRIPSQGSPLVPIGGGGGGGGGGQRMEYVVLSPPPAAPRPATPPAPAKEPVVVPPVEPEEPEPKPEPVPPPPRVAIQLPQGTGVGPARGAGTGPGDGPGTGGGTGGGEGTGVGPGTGPGTGGEGGTLTPPNPRQMILPPLEKPPKDLRGRTIRILFFVRADGTVERIQVDPEIRDGDYADKLDEAMLRYRFRPARMPDGTAVAAAYPIEVTLPQ